jgi:peptidoglycan hydrolase-like protein with peptidoglycan-binding domain
MKVILFVLFVTLTFAASIGAQTAPATQTSATEAKPKKSSFRANKAQIEEAQKMLKAKNLYSGEVTGKTNPDWKAAVKTYQNDNGLKKTGSLNRATLEKMGVELTDKQKAIPVSPNSYASTEPAKAETTTKTTTTTETKTRKPPFRASKDQINEAQRMLKGKSMYNGEETGTLDDATREGLKKFQEASGLKVTGTLNRVTLEKMGIELTDKQKADAAEGNK